MAYMSELNALEKFLIRLDATLPEMCRTNDLIEAGVYHSAQAACAARKRGNGPDHIYINSRHVSYPKEAVLEFLKSRLVFRAQKRAEFEKENAKRKKIKYVPQKKSTPMALNLNATK